MTNTLSFKTFAVINAIVLLQACATQPAPPITTEAPQSIEAQKAAQKQALAQNQQQSLNLKRKVAIGRISNESLHGKSFLRDNNNDPLGKQISDLLAQRLIESGQFLVIERPDINIVQSESTLTQSELNMVGVDSIILGSLAEFGRSNKGSTGFWSRSKIQTANAKIALRLVDASNGLAYFSATGAGKASTESGEVAFAGSTASYDGELNDAAIANAVSDVVDNIISNLSERPWSTSILSTKGDRIFVSGGKSQGIRPGLILQVMSEGEKIKSPQTGFLVTLPGEAIATIEIISNFGETETNEGSVAKVISGSLAEHNIQNLKIIEGEK